MCNEELIAQAVIAAELYSVEEVDEMLAMGEEIPVHTYQGWLARHRQVRKGEKAALECMLWKRKKPKKGEDQPSDESPDSVDPEQSPEQKSKFILVKSFLFTGDQVD